MPSSPPFHITTMMQYVEMLSPKSVLDIGVGFGKWGFLCREYLDISKLRYWPADWQVRIDGCEAFPEYKTPVYDYVYNEVFYGDIREVITRIGHYDLVIIGDVIEHFPKDVGKQLLADLTQKCDFILLSSPTKFFEQEALGNPFERHLSLWGMADFAGLAFEYQEFHDYLFAALIDCKRSGVVSNKQTRSSELVYGNELFRRRPKLAQMAKSVLMRVLPQ